MAVALPVASMLAAGGSAVAGAGATAFSVAGTAVSFGSLATGLGIVGQAFSMFQGMQQADAAYDAEIAASRAALESSKAQVAQADVEAQRARTQEALEEAERQRRLRRALASQRAQMAGGGADVTQGTPASIQDATVGEINRESRLAGIGLDDTISSINAQKTGIRAAGLGKAVSLINSAGTSYAASQQTLLEQGAGLVDSVGSFVDTFKTNKSVPIPGRKPTRIT